MTTAEGFGRSCSVCCGFRATAEDSRGSVSLTSFTLSQTEMNFVSFPVLKTQDPHQKLKIENRRKNVFVTQLEDYRGQNNEHIKTIPVITETSSGILETGVNTLQTTLVLKKQVEVDEVNRKLLDKREEFKGRMLVLQQRTADLQQKQMEIKQRAAKFEKFVAENEVKCRRALKKFQIEKQQNESKEKEKNELSTQLEGLLARRLYLKERLKKYKIFEEFLLKVLELIPDNYLGYGTDLVTPIIRRYETLSVSRQDLLKELARLTDELKTRQHNLETIKQEHKTHKLMTNQEITELQTRLDLIKEKNKQLEMKLQMHLGQSRDQVEELGNVLMAMRNLGEQCYLNHYGPLELMDMFSIMDMTKEFIMEKSDMEKRAMRLADTSLLTPVKNTSSQIHLKSTSKSGLKMVQQATGQ